MLHRVMTPSFAATMALILATGAAPAPLSAQDAPAAHAPEDNWRMTVSFVHKDQGWAPLPFERFHGLIFFPARINGVEATVMLDNGSPTSIDAEFARKAGLSPLRNLSNGKTSTGELSRQLMQGAVIDIPHLVTVSGPIQAVDFRPLAGLIGHRVDAMLGGDTLKVMALALMPGSQTLVLVPTGAAHINGPAATLPLVENDQVAAQIDGKPVKLAIDLGSNDTVSLFQAAWQRIIPADAPIENSTSTNAEGVIHTIQRSPGHMLQVGPVKVNGVSIPNKGTLPKAEDGLLGGAFLAHFNTLLDIGAGTLTLTAPDTGTARQP
jgi:hypothetical protein